MSRNFIHRKLIIPLAFYAQRSRRMTYYNELIRNEKNHKKNIEELALKRLRLLLRYAKNNVPYYSSLFRSTGFDTDIKSISDLAHLPILEKSTIQQYYASFITKHPEKFHIIPNATGGSTGEPLKFFITRYSHDYGLADIMRHYHWTGWHIGEKHAFLWGAERDNPVRTLKGRIHAWALRYKWLNSFKLNTQMMRKFANSIQKYKPVILIGYATSLYTFAKFLEAEGIELQSIQGVQSSAETLFDWQRKLIRKQFNCNVFDRYGCREIGNIAHECSAHNGLHISQELMHVEVLRNGEPADFGQEGDIVVTSFMNYAFPFVRYSIGDRGALIDDGACECGRELVRMSPKLGRKSDNFYFENGLVVHGEYFTHLFYNIKNVKQFQVIQKSYSQIIIRIVTLDGTNKIPLKRIISDIQSWVGLPIEVEFEFLERIEPTSTGKLRFTVSEVKPPS